MPTTTSTAAALVVVVLLLLLRVLVLLLLLLILLLSTLLLLLWVLLLLILLLLMLLLLWVLLLILLVLMLLLLGVLLLILLALMLLLLWVVLLLILLASPTVTPFAPAAFASACSSSTPVAPTTRAGNKKGVALSVSRPLLLGYLHLDICVQHNILRNLSAEFVLSKPNTLLHRVIGGEVSCEVLVNIAVRSVYDTMGIELTPQHIAPRNIFVGGLTIPHAKTTPCLSQSSFCCCGLRGVKRLEKFPGIFTE